MAAAPTDGKKYPAHPNSEFVALPCSDCGLSPVQTARTPLSGAYTLRNKLEPDTEYEWCACGLSATQPLCDGACFKWRPGDEGVSGAQQIPGPVKFRTASHRQSIHIVCGCKYTKQPPYCDGVHSSIPIRPDYAPCQCGEKKTEDSEAGGKVTW
jgi:CDGSH-type Zn-finger protein